MTEYKDVGLIKVYCIRVVGRHNNIADSRTTVQYVNEFISLVNQVKSAFIENLISEKR